MNSRIDMTHGADQFCVLPSGVRLCFREHGSRDSQPLLLIAGLGLQLHYWSRHLIERLVSRGFRVIVFDNRDVGRSSFIDLPAPGLLSKLFARRDPRGYRLEDMAQDACGLLDHLGIARAHVWGMSMGGMIGQCLAAQYPQRVISLVSLFSTTGARNVGQPATSTLWRMARQRVARDANEAVANYESIMAHIGPTRYAMPAEDLRSYAREAWHRGPGVAANDGESRQIGAIINSGDRTAQLHLIRAPTLVIHGDVDRMVAPSGGTATASAISGAAFVTLEGIGHYVPDGVVGQLVPLIERHAGDALQRAETASSQDQLSAPTCPAGAPHQASATLPDERRRHA